MTPAKWSYAIALDRAPNDPLRELGEHESFNFTAVVPQYGLDATVCYSQHGHT